MRWALFTALAAVGGTLIFSGVEANQLHNSPMALERLDNRKATLLYEFNIPGYNADRRRWHNSPGSASQKLSKEELGKIFKSAQNSEQLAKKLTQYFRFVIQSVEGIPDRIPLRDTVILIGKNRDKDFGVSHALLKNVTSIVQRQPKNVTVKPASDDKWAPLIVEMTGNLDHIDVAMHIQEHSPKYANLHYQQGLGKNSAFTLKGQLGSKGATCEYEPLSIVSNVRLTGKFCVHCSPEENLELKRQLKTVISSALTTLPIKRVFTKAFSKTVCLAFVNNLGHNF